MIQDPDKMYVYECDGCAACCTCYSVPVNEDDLRREPAIRPHVERVGDDLLMNYAGGLPGLVYSPEELDAVKPVKDLTEPWMNYNSENVRPSVPS